MFREYIYKDNKNKTYRKDGIKIAIIPRIKEINELQEFVGGIEIFSAHAVEMEVDSGGEDERVDSIQVCIKEGFL